MADLIDVPANDPCPCNSGLKYVECCRDRVGSTWKKDPATGDYVKQIQMDEESVKMMEKHKEYLEKEVYKRPLRPDDKLFPDMDSSVYISFTIKTLLDTKTENPYIYYIFLKEGILLSSQNINKLNTHDRIDIASAAASYLQHPDKVKLLEPYKKVLGDDYERLLAFFKSHPGDEQSLHELLDLVMDEAVIAAYKKAVAPKIGRNDTCPCGSGKKYKKCCQDKGVIIKVDPNDNTLEKMNKFLTATCGSAIKEFLIKTARDGKHYHIGGISEIMDTSLDTPPEDLHKEVELFSAPIPFNISYVFDMDEKGNARREGGPSFLASMWSIGESTYAVSGWIFASDSDISIIPCLAVMGDMKGVDPEIMMMLSESQKVERPEATYYLLGGGDEIPAEEANETSEYLFNWVVDALYRFLLIRKDFNEVIVFPNSNIKTGGFIKLPVITKDYAILEQGGHYLGYSRKKEI